MKDYKKYIPNFSEGGLWKKVTAHAAKFGQRTIYSILLLFYAYRRKETPYWAKNIVLGVLGYLITPIDFIPDLTPIIGYTDDVGILSFGLVTIAAFVNDEVKVEARKKLAHWFSNLDEDALAKVDSQL